MDLICSSCGGRISFKFNPYKWVTLKCGCKVRIIYPRGAFSVIGEKDYNPNHKGGNKNV